MRSTVALLILSLLVCQAFAAIVVERAKDNDVEYDMNKFSVLCTPCKKFFNEIKKDLPEVSEITEDILKEVIDVSYFRSWV
jgi:hypothetical protein